MFEGKIKFLLNGYQPPVRYPIVPWHFLKIPYYLKLLIKDYKKLTYRLSRIDNKFEKLKKYTR